MGAEDTNLVGERNFYRRLLELTSADEPAPLLEQALEAIVNVSGAVTAYVELRDSDDDRASAPSYWRAHGCTDADVTAIRASISRGIVARALEEGRTVATPSAVADPSFRDQASVLRHGIQAVLCAPIGRPAFGVIYLQSADASDSFLDRNQSAIELFAAQVAFAAERLLARNERPALADATTEIRKRFRCDGIAGRSKALADVLQKAAQTSTGRITVLITGPVGTGKSALARAIANNSARATGPFIDLNCATIPEQMLEAELFGAEPGAYTGATKRMLGKVAAARGGTLFLDEVAELSMAAQAKLLQLIQERRFYPLGSTTPVIADVRVLSATNADLKARVASGRFREDLYYRLAVASIALPTLDERREDIPLLAEQFCAAAWERIEKPPRPMTRRALLACREGQWPGNVRQLENAIEAAVMCANFEDASAVDEEHVYPDAPHSDASSLTFREVTRRTQRRCVEESLRRNEWNITRTALELDLNRQHLHDLINALGLKRP